MTAEAISSKTGELSDSLKLAILNAQICQDKLANDVFILDLQNSESSPTDFFVICSCDSPQQVQAVAERIYDEVADYKLKKPRMEGFETGEWVLIDYFDIVVHVMYKETREFYKIEKLWGDADFYTVDDEAEISKTSYEEVLRIYP